MKKNNAIRETRRDRIFLNVLLAISVIILIIELYPLVYVVSASFSSSDAISRGQVYLLPVEFSLDGYKMLSKNKDILTGFTNSVLYLIVGTSINMLLTVALAYPLSRKELPFRNMLTLFIVFTMYVQGGLIPTYLQVSRMNLVDTLWGLILPNAIITTNMIIMRTYFQTSLPESLHEAAVLDGCNYTCYLLKIVLPLSLPILAVVGLYYAVGHWNNYFDALIYLRSRDKQSLQLVLRDILLANQVNSGDGSYSESSKLGVTIKYSVIVVSCIPMMIAYPFVQKFFVKGVMIGALKG
ncbi:MAG: carbohydrate ABC transporter permease [Clostridiales bacterium]|jgi:ABC transporter, permease protein|nr:carbohydrate ABC transporter permease [Clostridiales bacterium]OKZ73014.1 MAG: sugar ABC transporter permease [Clostridiales bacterium 41_12_two_minus]